MKNQNPQDILNEILLRMRYDSSKTLSENKEIILEQGGYYYTPAGQLVRPTAKLPNPDDFPAKQIYPNITDNKYPLQADVEKMQIALRNRSLNRIVSQMPKTRVFPKVPSRVIDKDNARIAPGSFGTPPVGQLESDEQILNRERYESFMRRKKVDVGFDNEFEVPGTTNLYYWNENDHNDLTSFLNSFTFKDGSSDDWVEFFTLPGNKYQKEYVMPIGKVKGFTFKYKGVDLTFKRTATSDEFLNEFGTVIDGKYYKYVKYIRNCD